MRQCYVTKDFKQSSLNMVRIMNNIIREYQSEGYVLTVRQLYYQLVARDIIANNLQEYKKVAGLINDAKLAGLIDWSAIEDRTRDFIQRARWSGGSEILQTCAESFHMDMWDNQDCRVFVIVEKEALVGVMEKTCRKYDVPLLAARGYPSGSVLREFAVDVLKPAFDSGQFNVILHLGDHDPSGIDMTRDLENRLSLFAEEPVEIHRIALNMDQIEEENPPENPAKSTDSRFKSYLKMFGPSSWELDALNPQYVNKLLVSHISAYIDEERWDEKSVEIEDVRSRIQSAADTFE